MLSPPRKKQRSEGEKKAVCSAGNSIDEKEENDSASTQEASETELSICRSILVGSEAMTEDLSPRVEFKHSPVDAFSTDSTDKFQHPQVLLQEKHLHRSPPRLPFTSLSSSHRCTVEPNNSASLHHPHHYAFHWSVQVFQVICKKLKSSPHQPYQLPNSVLLQLSNELIDLMEWLGVETFQHTTSTLLWSLYQTVGSLETQETAGGTHRKTRKTESSSSSLSPFLKDDTVILMATKDVMAWNLFSFGVWSHTVWSNPGFVRLMFNEGSVPDKTSEQWKAVQWIERLVSGYKARQDASQLLLSLTSIFILGTVSMVMDVLNEMWSRIHRIVMAVNTEPLDQLIEGKWIEGRGFKQPQQNDHSVLPLDESQRELTLLRPIATEPNPLSGVPLILVMFYSLFINEGLQMLHCAKLPNDFHSDVEFALQKLRQIQEKYDRRQKFLKALEAGQNGQISISYDPHTIPSTNDRLAHLPSHSPRLHGLRSHDASYQDRKDKVKGRSSTAQCHGGDGDSTQPVGGRRQSMRNHHPPSHLFHWTSQTDSHENGEGIGKEREDKNTAAGEAAVIAKDEEREETNQTSEPRRTDHMEVSEITFHRSTNSWHFSWFDDQAGKRRYKYFSLRLYGNELAKQKAQDEQQRVMEQRAGQKESTTIVTASQSVIAPVIAPTIPPNGSRVTYSKKTGYWTCRHGDKKSVCFNRRHFGMKGAERLAMFAKQIFDSRKSKTRAITRSDVFELYEKTYGSVPIKEAGVDDDNDEGESDEEVEENDGVAQEELLVNAKHRDEEKDIRLHSTKMKREALDEDETHLDRLMRNDLQNETEDSDVIPEHTDDESDQEDDGNDPELLLSEGPSLSSGVNQSGVVGVVFNRNTQNWTAKISVEGSAKSCNWASKKYGYENARQLAILAKHEGESMGQFPSRASLLKLLEAQQQQQQQHSELHAHRNIHGEGLMTHGNYKHNNCMPGMTDSHNSVMPYSTIFNPLASFSPSQNVETYDSFQDEEFKNHNHMECNEDEAHFSDETNRDDFVSDGAGHVPGVTYLARENAWRCKWWSRSQNRQITKTFYASRYGYSVARQLAVDCRKEKERVGEIVKRPPARETGIHYDPLSHSWISRWKRQAVSFDVNEFGNATAKWLCQLARREAEQQGELPSKETLIAVWSRESASTSTGDPDVNAETQQAVDDLSFLLQTRLMPDNGTTDHNVQPNEDFSSQELAQLSLELLSNLMMTEEEGNLMRQDATMMAYPPMPGQSTASHAAKNQQPAAEEQQTQNILEETELMLLQRTSTTTIE